MVRMAGTGHMDVHGTCAGMVRMAGTGHMDVHGTCAKNSRVKRMVRMAGTGHMARVSQLRRHGAHGWYWTHGRAWHMRWYWTGMVRLAGTGHMDVHGTCAGTGHMDVAKRGRFWPRG
uniref:Uncharacterized protein n=1 Tax=Oryza sativa subsp. japonica TaxID=39947 RepID=Q8W5G8_ORYSJ|nr:hypothetical protein [Oryza sativa Japonica Group]